MPKKEKEVGKKKKEARRIAGFLKKS